MGSDYALEISLKILPYRSIQIKSGPGGKEGRIFRLRLVD